MTKVTKLPPGEALGARDLQEWGKRRTVGRSGMKSAPPSGMSPRKSKHYWARKHWLLKQRTAGKRPFEIEFKPDPAFWEQWATKRAEMKALGYRLVKQSDGSWVGYLSYKDKF